MVEKAKSTEEMARYVASKPREFDFGVDKLAAHRHPTQHNLSPVEGDSGPANVRKFPLYPRMDEQRRVTTEYMKNRVMDANPKSSEDAVNEAMNKYFGGDYNKGQGAKILKGPGYTE